MLSHETGQLLYRSRRAGYIRLRLRMLPHQSLAPLPRRDATSDQPAVWLRWCRQIGKIAWRQTLHCIWRPLVYLYQLAVRLRSSREIESCWIEPLHCSRRPQIYISIHYIASTVSTDRELLLHFSWRARVYWYHGGYTILYIRLRSGKRESCSGLDEGGLGFFLLLLDSPLILAVG